MVEELLPAGEEVTCSHCKQPLILNRRDQGIAQLTCRCGKTRLDDPAVCREKRRRLRVLADA